ncbi:MAG TPA: BON domain-containing protein [Microvirga sp.]|nr:BON domain-containing protein [Microvirga sp.]
MGEDRWRDDRNRDPLRSGPAYGRGTDYRGDGTIARRGFGTERAGYDPSAHDGHRGRSQEEGRERSGDPYPGGYRSASGFGDRHRGGAYGSDYRGGGTAGGRHDRGYGAGSDGRSYEDYDRGSDRSEHVLGPDDFETPGYGEWGMPARRRHDDPDRDAAHRSGEDRGFWQAAAEEVSSWFGGDEADRSTGEAERPNHRGRGPKGYTRSDERIREDVCERLTHDAYVDASDIEISVANREVTLSGFVDSREAKRRAEDIADHVSGVAHVQNNLRVRQAGMGSGSDGQDGATSGGGMSPAAASDIMGGAPGAGGTGVEVSRSEGTGSRRRGGGA